MPPTSLLKRKKGGYGEREKYMDIKAVAMAEHAGPESLASVKSIEPEGLVALLEGALDRVLLIDSRPFVDYNTSHILEAVNVNCSKLMKRRLQQDKVQISELLQHSAKKKVRKA